MTTKGGFFETDLVAGQLKAASAFVAEGRSEWFRFQTGVRLKHGCHFDSPLESVFYTWWSAVQEIGEYDWVVKELGLHLTCQQEIVAGGERLRLDFVVEALDSGDLEWPRIAIEVDGHGFHEKTPEQVARRDRRDRLLQQGNWKVFHFSYSELTTNPSGCVVGVWDYITDVLHDALEIRAQKHEAV